VAGLGVTGAGGWRHPDAVPEAARPVAGVTGAEAVRAGWFGDSADQADAFGARPAGSTSTASSPGVPTAAAPGPSLAGSRVRAKAAAREAERRRRPPWFVREFLLTVALVGVMIGMIIVVVEAHWRQGLFGVGVVLLVLALARLVLPARLVGMLAVRGRLFDTVTLLALGSAVIGLMLEVPLPTR
jgi:hypothetical protein